MTTDRFDWQRTCVDRALQADDEGLIINCGANDDPAHLKRMNPARVVNCDLFAHDETMGRANAVDVLFDAARDRWPFTDREASLVVLGDILEHMTADEMLAALREARRVSRRLCVSVPEDHRPETGDPAHVGRHPRGAVHQTIVTEALLRDLLEQAGWKPGEWRHVTYDDGTFWGQRVDGHFLDAE